MKVKEESEKFGLKLNIQKAKIMASDPNTSWQIDGEQWKQWQTLFSLAPKSLQMVTAAMKRSTSRLYIVTLLFNLYAEHLMWNAGLDEV